MSKMITQFRKARKASCPLLVINTPDPHSTVSAIAKYAEFLYNDIGEQIPILEWNIIEGWQYRNGYGKTAIEQIEQIDKSIILFQLEVTNPIQSLEFAQHLPENTILFIHNAQNFFDPTFNQAVWNLRNSFKEDNRMLILLGPHIKLPVELQNDFIILEQDYPNYDELFSMSDDLLQESDIHYTREIIDECIKILKGIPMFAAEQSLAMSLIKDSIDFNQLWEQKYQLINETPGLKVWNGDESFKDIGGCDNVKQFLTRIINGKNKPNLVVFMDEIEKDLAAATHSVGDNTGISQDQLKVLLTEMENKRYAGTIFIGPPGAAKSAIAKAVGKEAGIPTITLDLGGLKTSAAGESEARIRTALKLIESISDGQALFIATCNKLISLPPEIKRRFTMGTFFFDLPTKEERDKIWDIYLRRYGSDDMVTKDFDPDNWTGAEIRNCCELADRLNISVEEAAEYIVPVYTSNFQQIEQLRQEASGKYLSANNTGLYKYEIKEEVKSRGKRKINHNG